MKINESGRSMIEMLGVLAIIGVLSVGGIAGYSKAMNKYRVNKTIDQISHIAANTRILFSSQRSYADLSDLSVIKKAKLLPDDLNYTLTTSGSGSGQTTSGSASNAFAGNVILAPANRFSSAGDGDQKAFTITYTGVPQEACIEILTVDWGTGTAGGIISLGTAGGVTGVLSDGGSHSYADGVGYGAMSVENAVDACNDPTNNTLIFKFY